MNDAYAAVHWYARPELKERLILLHGSQMGYRANAVALIAAAPGGKTVRPNFVWKVLNAYDSRGRGPQAAPMWMVVVLVRIAEEDPFLSAEQAIQLASSWFTTEPPKGDAADV